jgi:hypothetical protein
MGGIVADDNNTAIKAGVVLGGLGLLAAAFLGGKKKSAPGGMAGPQPPKLRKNCNCGR